MANYTISKRSNKNGTVFYARVRVKEKGLVTFSKSKSFHSKVAATKWAQEILRKVESNINDLDILMMDCTLGQLIKEYLNKKLLSGKPIGRTATYCLKQILRYPISQMLASKIKAKDIIDYCIQRKNANTKPSPSTIAIDISCLRKVLKIAKPIFNINVTDNAIIDAYPALHDLNLFARSNKRNRRLENDEYAKIFHALSEKEKHAACIIPYTAIFTVSILTCCRIGEVCNFRWRDLDMVYKTILVRDRKSPNGSAGNNDILPLLGDTLEILLNQPKTDERIFPFNARSITAGFRKSIRKLGINELRYHDLRREGASRLIEMGYSIEETARVTGHKDLNVLWQVYVNIHPKHFVEKQHSKN